MNVTVTQKPRIIVEVLAEIEGEEFDLFDLRELLITVDSEPLQIEEPLASQLVSLGILASPGDGAHPAVPGPRFMEAKQAVTEAIGEADIDLPLSR